ncbi:MAG: HEAT repeat domain-containing protein [Gemmatimonadaceae bacterium]
MKFISGFFFMVLGVAAANAQTPPARPTQPVRPAPAPAPAAAPRAARLISPDDPDYSMYYRRAMDAIDSKAFISLNDLKVNLDDLKLHTLMSADVQEHVRDAVRIAGDGQRMALDASRDAIREAQRSMEGLNLDRALAPLARINVDEIAQQARAQSQIAREQSQFMREQSQQMREQSQQMREDMVAAHGFAPFPALTPISPLPAISSLAPLMPRWTQEWSQDRDPADSVFNDARSAFSRGDWRRSAEMFAQVYAKFPKSTRVQSAAYYEAFSRYRIGTTDELKSALRVINDRVPAAMNGSSNSQNMATTVSAGQSYGQGYSYSMSSANTNEVRALHARILGVLAQRGDADAAKQLQNTAQKGGNCDSEEMQVRSEALSAIAQSDMVAATPILRRVLDKKDPCTLELRRRALGILLRRADTAATSAAISVAKNADETIDLRTDAISYLAKLPGDNAMAALEDLLRTSTDRDVQRAAVRSLSNTDNPKARQSIRAIIERSDVNEDLRVEAINTMERDRGGSPEDATYLRGLFPKLQAERLKIAALAAISKTQGTENEQFILALARNTGESSAVRSSAVSRMYRMSAISIADIGKLYDGADSRAMREQVISVLSQRKEPETIDKLGDIAKNSTDPNARSRAIQALNRKDDPRARKLILDLVGTP